MPRGSEELTNARKAEIVNACAVLYETRSFKEITLKEIGEKTSFTRTSIYNYFQTKEEIFLALFQREYEAWSRIWTPCAVDTGSCPWMLFPTSWPARWSGGSGC